MKGKNRLFSKEEWSWIGYDWANSVYATIMMAALFPIFFTAMAGDELGDIWWGYGSSIATLIMAVLAPVTGCMGDIKGRKKKIFTIYLIIGLLGTACTILTSSWQVMLVAYIISDIGFAGSCMVYDSFLTDVTTDERMDKVSAWGYSAGYIGGSTIPFLVAIVLVMVMESSVQAIKISVVLTVVWWGLFSIPFLKNVHQKYYTEASGHGIFHETFSNLKRTALEIIKNKKILCFSIAYFFYIDGVGTIIKMSTAYGTALGLDSTGMILALLVTQIVAVPCAILFSKLGEKIGSINVILLGIGIYALVCIVGYIMGLGMEEEFLTNSQALAMFWTLAVLVGTSQGGIQSMSRSYYGKIIPNEKSNEYFGFFDIFGKFAAVIGPFMYSTMKTITGRTSSGIIGIAVLFIIGGLILIVNHRTFAEKA